MFFFAKMCVNSDRIPYKTKSWGEYPGCGLHEEGREPSLPTFGTQFFTNRIVLSLPPPFGSVSVSRLVCARGNHRLVSFGTAIELYYCSFTTTRLLSNRHYGARRCVTNNQFFVQGLMPTTEHSKRPTPTHGECLRHTVRRDMTQ